MPEKNSEILHRQSIRDKAKRQGLDPARVFTQIAYNQLLRRLAYTSASDIMLKGGQALHVRGASSRTTRDIDLRGGVSDSRAATRAVLAAAKVELEDGLNFEPKDEPRPLKIQRTGGHPGFNVGFKVSMGGRYWAEVSVDVAAGREPMGRVETAPYPLPFNTPGLTPASIAVFPIEAHLSDKVWATVSTYGFDGASTRVRDLYDICAIARTTAVDAGYLLAAIEAERLRREAPALKNLAIPPAWKKRWPELHRTYGSETHVPDDFAAAMALAQTLIDPVLSGAVTRGAWDHEREVWTA